LHERERRLQLRELLPHVRGGYLHVREVRSRVREEYLHVRNVLLHVRGGDLHVREGRKHVRETHKHVRARSKTRARRDGLRKAIGGAVTVTGHSRPIMSRLAVRRATPFAITHRVIRRPV
jgi:hypothetical protein